MRFVAITSALIFIVQSVFATFAVASEKFAIKCKSTDIEPHWHEGSVFIGDELDNFREKVSPYLLAAECSPEEFTSTAWCDLNDKWKIDEETYLVKTWCNSGAYNFNTAWFFLRGDNVEPLRLIKPNFKWLYQDTDEHIIKSIRQDGFLPPSNLRTGASFDPETLRLQHFDFCCMGDISRSFSWVLMDGVFVLTEYEADEIQNGENEPQIKVNFQ